MTGFKQNISLDINLTGGKRYLATYQDLKDQELAFAKQYEKKKLKYAKARRDLEIAMQKNDRAAIRNAKESLRLERSETKELEKQLRLSTKLVRDNEKATQRKSTGTPFLPVGMGGLAPMAVLGSIWKSLTEFGSFDEAIGELKAKTALSEVQQSQIINLIKNIAGQSQLKSSEVAAVATELYKSGMRHDDVLRSLLSTTQLMLTQTGLHASDWAQILASATKNFGGTFDKSGFADLFSATTVQSSADAHSLISSLREGGLQVFGSALLPMDQLFALLGAVSDISRGSEFRTKMKAFARDIAKSEKTEKIGEFLGLDRDFSKHQMRDIVAKLGEKWKSIESQTPQGEDASLRFQTQLSKYVTEQESKDFALTVAKSSDKFDALLQHLQHKGKGNLDEQVAVKRQTFNNKFAEFLSALSRFSVSLGSLVSPALIASFDALGNVLNNVAKGAEYFRSSVSDFSLKIGVVGLALLLFRKRLGNMLHGISNIGASMGFSGIGHKKTKKGAGKKGLLGKLSHTIGKLGNKIGGLGSKLGKFGKLGLGSLASLGLGLVLQPLIDAVSGWFDTHRQHAQHPNLLPATNAVAMPIDFDMLKNAFTDLIAVCKSGFNHISAFCSDIILPAFNKILQVANQGFHTIKSLWKTAISGFERIRKTCTNFILPTFKNLGKLAQAVYKKIADMAGLVVGSVANGASWVWETLKKGFDKAQKSLGLQKSSFANVSSLGYRNFVAFKKNSHHNNVNNHNVTKHFLIVRADNDEHDFHPVLG